MEHDRFDTLTRGLAHGLTRRGALSAFAALTGAALATDDVAGKKKKKVTICRNGQTLTVTKKKKQKHLQSGDTEGPCSPLAPPVSPPVSHLSARRPGHRRVRRHHRHRRRPQPART